MVEFHPQEFLHLVLYLHRHFDDKSVRAHKGERKSMEAGRLRIWSIHDRSSTHQSHIQRSQGLNDH